MAVSPVCTGRSHNASVAAGLRSRPGGREPCAGSGRVAVRGQESQWGCSLALRLHIHAE